MFRNVEFLLLALCALSVYGINIPICPYPNGKHPELFPHDECGKFWQCSNGIPYLMVCPAGLYFDIESKRCQWPERARCHESIDETTVVAPTDDISEICSAIDTPHPIYLPDRDCTKFWKCFKGSARLQNCPEGLLFNRALNICDFAQKVQCESETTTVPSIVTETTVVPSQLPPSGFPGLTTRTGTIFPTTHTSLKPIPSSMVPRSSKRFSTTDKCGTSPSESTTSDETICSQTDAHNGKLGCIPPATTQVTAITEISPSFTPETSTDFSSYTDEEDEDFSTTDFTTEEPTKTTAKYIPPTVDSDEDDRAGYHQDEEITTTKRAEITTQETDTGDKAELITQVCQNLPEDEFQASHPFDCSKFLFCVHGTVIIMDCPANTWYDPMARKCLFPQQAHCIIWRYEKNTLVNQKNTLPVYKVSSIQHYAK